MATPSKNLKIGPFHVNWRVAIVVVLAIVVLVNVLVFGILAWSLNQSRESHLAKMETEAQNISHLLERKMADSIDKIETAMMVVNREMIRQKKGGRIDARELQEFLEQQQSRIPEMGNMLITDADGEILHSTEKDFPAETTVADRGYFQHLRAHHDAGMVVSKPLISRASNEWVIVFSKRLQDEVNGKFVGVINGTLELKRIYEMFSLVNAGEKGTIVLRDKDLATIVRYPGSQNWAQFIGQKTAPQLLVERVEKGQLYGVYTARSLTDDYERITSFRRVGNFPLYLSVGLAIDDALSAWRKDVLSAGGILLAFFLLTMSMTVQLSISWHRHEQLIEQLDRKQKAFQSLAVMSSDWFWEQDENFRFVEGRDVIATLYGRNPKGGFLGKTRWEVATDKSEEEWQAHRAVLEAHQPFYDFEYAFIDNTGEKCWLLVSGQPIFDEEGRFTGYRGVAKNITEHKRYEERIQQIAQYDNLTQLPNRALFYDRMDQMLRLAKREQRGFALLYFDLDKFKPVNDRYGHDAGDQLLQLVAARLLHLLRESDTVARLGGDEFVVLLPIVTDHLDAEEVAKKIIDGLMASYKLDGVPDPINIGVSIGIAVYPRDGLDRDSLIKLADEAMYRAKQVGNCYFFHDGTTNCEFPSVS